MKIIAKKNIPNYITVLRIVGTAFMLFLEPLSVAFYVAYTISGVSDALDGFIARKMKLTSEFGAKLDSIADLLFYATMLLKIFPLLLQKVSTALWILVGIILGLRVCTYGIAAVKFKRFAAIHTYMNKLTGLAVFLIPYLFNTPIFVAFCWGAGVLAVIAVLQEMAIHIRSKDYCAG